MKKYVAIIALALGLSFTVVPAQAVDKDHPPADQCAASKNEPSPCPTPPPCGFDKEHPCPVECLAYEDYLTDALSQALATVSAQHEKILHQRAVIKRLRHRLHRG